MALKSQLLWHSETARSDVLLEPIFKVKVTVPDNTGDVISDINARGRIENSDMSSGAVV